MNSTLINRETVPVETLPDGKTKELIKIIDSKLDDIGQRLDNLGNRLRLFSCACSDPTEGEGIVKPEHNSMFFQELSRLIDRLDATHNQLIIIDAQLEL